MQIGAHTTRTGPSRARDRRDRQQPRRQRPAGRAADRGRRRGGRGRGQVPDPHRRGGDAPVDADAAALRRAALRVHAADGAHARRAPPAEGATPRSAGLLFFSSPFSVEAVELLEQVDVPAYKIASGEVTNPPLIEAVAATGQARAPLDRHVGDRGDRARGARSCASTASTCSCMQCTSNYPCPPEKVNLRAMTALRRALRHARRALRPHARTSTRRSPRSRSAPSAIEKHFTLVEAPLRPRPPRVAGAGGPRAARRRRAPGRGGARQRREGARPRARPGPGDVREERRHAASRSRRAP